MRTGFGHWSIPTGRRRCQLQIQYGHQIVAMRISQIVFPLSSPEPRVFWCLSEGSPVGFVSFSVIGTSAKINDLYVVPAQRRKGIGSFLVRAVFEITDGLGVERIDLNVRRDNPSALAFWESKGFMIGHHELTQYRNPHKRIGFRGALSSDFAEEV